MGTLDALRTWRDRNPEANTEDWRVAQGQGWKPDTFNQDAVDHGAISQADADRYDANERRSHRLDNRSAADRIPTERFIIARPRADRYVFVLIRQLTELNPEAGHTARGWYDRNREGLTVDQGSEWITRLKNKIAEGAVSAPIDNVNAALEVTRPSVWTEWRELCTTILNEVDSIDSGARFAIRNEAGNANDISFWYIVNRPAEGSTRPRFFLRQYIGGQGAVRVRMRPEQMVSIARKIRDDGPRAAMVLFGHMIGKCGDCGRDLTNKESRDLGVGPICRNRHGWL